MSQYYTIINDYFEDKACALLNHFLNPNYVVKRNNLSSNDIDLKVFGNDSNTLCTIDVQYSGDFASYGDVRVDLMSAGQLIKDNHKEIWKINKDIANSANSLEYFKGLFKINKYGKYFTKENNNMLGVIYYFYNDKIKNKELDYFNNREPDFIFFLPKRIVLDEIKGNPNLIIKINDKKSNGIHENHHSAFACLQVKDLCKKYNLPIFKTRDEMTLKFLELFEQELRYLNDR